MRAEGMCEPIAGLGPHEAVHKQGPRAPRNRAEHRDQPADASMDVGGVLAGQGLRQQAEEFPLDRGIERATTSSK